MRLLLALKYSEKTKQKEKSVTFVNSVKSVEAYQAILCVDVGSAKLYEAGKIPYALPQMFMIFMERQVVILELGARFFRSVLYSGGWPFLVDYYPIHLIQ